MATIYLANPSLEVWRVATENSALLRSGSRFRTRSPVHVYVLECSLDYYCNSTRVVLEYSGSRVLLEYSSRIYSGTRSTYSGTISFHRATRQAPQSRADNRHSSERPKLDQATAGFVLVESAVYKWTRTDTRPASELRGGPTLFLGRGTGTTTTMQPPPPPAPRKPSHCPVASQRAVLP